jgi:glycosyltransferase involved in cell wall biosynthesis
MRVIYLLIFIQSAVFSLEKSKEKILICGVCRDVAPFFEKTIESIELLGQEFADYHVIIYENDSKDNTRELFSSWAAQHPKVTFISEKLSEQELSKTRPERIAYARNRVLFCAKSEKYEEFKYMVMADLDFKHIWPVEEICKTIASQTPWDAVTANGLRPNGTYHDVYAFRDKKCPLGPELLGRFFWDDLDYNDCFHSNTPWVSVYSAFGGLGIYKMTSLKNSWYSGVVTRKLKKYYENILEEVPKEHPHLKKYCFINRFNFFNQKIPVLFRRNTPWETPKNYPFVICCEHVPLHASMALEGFDKFYVNPNLIMQY